VTFVPKIAEFVSEQVGSTVQSSDHRSLITKNNNSHLIVMLAYDGMSSFECAIAVESFARRDHEPGKNWYEFAVVALDEERVSGERGFVFHANGKLDLVEQAGTIIVPGWSRVEAPVPERLVNILRAAHGNGTRIVSLCTGVMAVAAAGLLKGRKATSHWKHVHFLAERHPDIDVQPNVLYVDNGDVLTSAGGAAGIDLCLHIIRKDFGTKAANMVARHMVAPPHRDGGQAQFILHHVPAMHEGTKIGLLLDLMRSDLAQTYSIKEMARIAGMSRSTFLRRFDLALGMPPAQWLKTERLMKAVDYLENTVVSIEEIAHKVGFSSASALREQFKKQYSVSPIAYRKLFQNPV